MPCPWTTHAAALLNPHSEIDIGIHLTLTSEWDAVKWRPLTHSASLVDGAGHFFPLLMAREGDGRPNLAEAQWSLDDIAREFRAQVALGVEMFSNASHVSSHMIRHFQDFDGRLEGVIEDICHEYGLANDALGDGLTRIEGYPKAPRDTAYRIESFVRQLADLEAGTYIFIDHPAVASPELSATGHQGYEDVASDRISCLGTLMSSAVQERVEELGIELISYRQL